MKLLGNLLWLLFGGLIIAFEYIVAGVLLCITIIGIPFGIQSFKMAMLAVWPFGRDTVVDSKKDGCLSSFMNILWIFIGGIWITISHLVLGIFLCITIIGIPFGKQHFKLMKVALTPFGRTIT